MASVTEEGPGSEGAGGPRSHSMSMAGADQSSGLGVQPGVLSPPRESGRSRAHSPSEGKLRSLRAGFCPLTAFEAPPYRASGPRWDKRARASTSSSSSSWAPTGSGSRPRETVELGVSVLEGPVVFHCGAEAQARGGEEIEAT